MQHLDFENDLLTPEDNLKYNKIQKSILKEHIKKELIGVFVKQLDSEDIYIKYHGLVGIRKLVSHETDPQISQAIDLGAVPLIFSIIKMNITPYHTYESCYILTNIASGNQEETAVVADLGGIELFIELTKSKIFDIAEQSVWALGNLAGDNDEYKNKILEGGGHQAIIEFAQVCEGLLNDGFNGSLNSLNQCVWALTNLCQNQSSLYIISNICKLLKYAQQSNNLLEVLNALSEHTKQQEVVQLLFENQCIKIILQSLTHKSFEVIRSASAILVDISMGSKEQAKYLIEQQLLKYIQKLLTHNKVQIRKLVVQLLQMIAISSYELTVEILKDQLIMNQLSNIAIQDQKLMIDAFRVYLNMTQFIQIQDLQSLINYKYFQIIQLFTLKQEKGEIKLIIDSIQNLIQNIDPYQLKTWQQEFQGILQNLIKLAANLSWQTEVEQLQVIIQKLNAYEFQINL
ncbi:hypothetical protein pb186bvf_002463 [Paramecium bursaria]